MFSESDMSALISIFGRMGGINFSLHEKREKIIEALAHFFNVRTWRIENTQSINLDQTSYQLVAMRNNRTLIFERDPKQASFTKKDRSLFQLVISRAPWLLENQTTASPPSPRLSPRMKTICLFVCLGAGRKQIAGALGLEHGTVDGYIRDLYRIYGVQSQKELIRLHAGDPIPGSRR